MYAQAILDGEKIKLTEFTSGDKVILFARGFYGLEYSQFFSHKKWLSFWKDLNRQGSALVYIDDILLMSNS